MYHRHVARAGAACWNYELLSEAAWAESKDLSMAPNLDIAPAAREDFEWCARLMASSEPWITLRRDLRGCEIGLRTPGRELFLARERGKPVGFILLSPYGMAASPYINTLAVTAEARSRGVGAVLLDFAERHFTGRKHLFLLCSSFNKRAQKFYRAHGYNFVGELKGYVVPEHDEFIFCKRISSADEVTR
jgi:ribosomal protein S18 acetylase RimI-like enzyme